MELTKIILEKKDGIAFITLNDPQNRNACGGAMDQELGWCLDDCNANPAVRVIVLRGAGENFSAGGNIKNMRKAFDEGGSDYGVSARRHAAIIAKFRTTRKPIIASIHGSVAGGGLSYALACDFRLAAEDTKFVFAFSRIGLVPDMGASFTLVKMLGPAKATELLMTAKPFTGKKAEEWGLVNEAVAEDKLEEVTIKFARNLAEGPTLAYEGIKALINKVSYEGLDIQMDNEAVYQKVLSFSQDHKEGVIAFLEKRKPVFKGR
jgi:Enoyl-CoA hydratase/carnithine racemase